MAIELRDRSTYAARLDCQRSRCTATFAAAESTLKLKRRSDRLVLHVGATKVGKTRVPRDAYHLFPCERVVRQECGDDTACLVFGATWDAALTRRSNTWLGEDDLAEGGGIVDVTFANGQRVRASVAGYGGNCMGAFQGIAVQGFDRGRPKVSTSSGPVTLPEKALGIGGARLFLVNHDTMEVVRRVPVPASTLGDFTFAPGLSDKDEVLLSQGGRCVRITETGAYDSATGCRPLTAAELSAKQLGELERALAGELGKLAAETRILTRPGSRYIVVFVIGAAC